MHPTFSRRHYQQIAKVISNIISAEYRTIITNDFVRSLKADNPQFDEERFYRACTHINYKEEN